MWDHNLIIHSNLVSNFIWDSANTYINLSGSNSLSVASLAAGACTDFYYNVLIKGTPTGYRRLS
jgi:hypothetical protein